jgi:CRISPR/Cas system Type II protein with McrA/HNH and RuvC-like nuclease domain
MQTMKANSKSNKSDRNLELAFDVGHSSIGWAVLEVANGKAPLLKGCGSVIFQADDCLASERREFRRQRRHIRATRLRVARIQRLL